MPKRNAEESVSPEKQRKRSSSLSPAGKKIAKVDTEDATEENVSSTVEKSVDKKRKRSVEGDRGGAKRKIDDQELDNSDAKPEAAVDEDSEEASPSKSEDREFAVNREDPVGLVAAKKSLFEILEGTIAEVPDARLVNEVRSLYGSIPEDDPFMRKTTVDTLFREYLMEELIPNKKSWDGLLNLSIKVSQELIVNTSLPITLLVDLIELSGLQECEPIFKFIEDRLSLWKQDHFYNGCKNAVLRMCNDILRRLSQTQNTILCGRILIFLSNFFPFSERSGLNVISEFNSDNVTLYKDDESEELDDKMEVEEEAEVRLFEGMNIQIPGLDKVIAQCQEQKKNNLKLDYNMYIKFWSLQDYLRNPVQCYNKVNWKTFALYTTDLLDALKSAKLLPEPEASADGNNEFEIDATPNASFSRPASPLFSPVSTSTFDVPTVGDENIYFAKYLTNRRVLELEMSDPGFRRSLMVQLLVVLQYLTLPVKFKHESHVLNDEQMDYVKKTTEKIYEILLDIKPGGKTFVETVKHILKREEIWNKWKNDGCLPIKKPVPPISVTTDPKISKAGKLSSSKGGGEDSPEFEEPATPVKPAVKQRPRLSAVLRNADAKNKFTLGNPELNRLWNICPDNLEACRSKARDFMPSIETYFSDAKKELDPEPVTTYDPKKEFKPKKILGNANFGWRGLRLLARRSPYFFQMVSGTPIHPLQNYLEFLLKKISADIELSLTTPTEDVQNPKANKADTAGESQAGTSNGVGVVEEAEMVTATEDEDDELTRPEGMDETKDDEEGEVKADVRNLTEEEQEKLGKSLGGDWKKLALKLGFTADEVEFFESERKEAAACFMLRAWTDQEGEDATVADLLYRLEGLGLQSKAEGIISV